MVRKVLFIDRDGTLIVEPDDEQVDALDKVRLVDDVIPSLLELARHGYRFVMVSNQDGLGTAAFPREDFDGPHALTMSLFESQGIRFDESAQPQPNYGAPSQVFPYILQFEKGNVSAEVEMIFADQATGAFVMKPGMITVVDPELVDLVYPAPSDQ